MYDRRTEQEKLDELRKYVVKPHKCSNPRCRECKPKKEKKA